MQRAVRTHRIKTVGDRPLHSKHTLAEPQFHFHYQVLVVRLRFCNDLRDILHVISATGQMVRAESLTLDQMLQKLSSSNQRSAQRGLLTSNPVIPMSTLPSPT